MSFDKEEFTKRKNLIYDGIQEVLKEIFEEIYMAKDDVDFELIADEVRETVFDIEELISSFHGLYAYAEKCARLKQELFIAQVQKDLQALPLYTGHVPDEPDYVTRMRNDPS